ncbi:TIGR03905 family TSCPD domain-containing protein [Clostridium cylindrosporum]|uniref:ribonucleoside-diphosphate reductase n=1 Tax=Clostridium cylindrosporum DSM 605 TaxID=1121307 RepID=A0A0J8DD80_CLOCY|nr:TIGR03905 family TSCPD domain-containing protein [Clostridium cylindrosporum]KMT22198.1 hypothetical protein CLCY_4c01710 [Clostridium cylindrosporum DSM 605]
MNSYNTKGVCSSKINFDVKDGIIEKVEFERGCSGNLQGISSLIRGMKVEDAISRLKGIDCGGRGTSCPDQLSKALEEYLSK